MFEIVNIRQNSYIMSDSGSSISETRMLERRISNNRADLNGDQQMNYFLSWFNTWSELQKSDFVPVLASKMSGDQMANVVNGFQSLTTKNPDRPPSLFSCQVKLFHDWFSGWSDDQKNYLVLRLKDIDSAFFTRYEDKIQNPESEGPKDYFEPGIPEELIRTSGTVHSNQISSIEETPEPILTNGKDDLEDDLEKAKMVKIEDNEPHDDEDEDSLKIQKQSSDSSSPLSPLSENVQD